MTNLVSVANEKQLERGLYSSTSKISQSNFFGLTILPNVLVRTGEQCIFRVRLEPYIRPAQLILQYRDHIVGHDRTVEVALEGQQQVYAPLSLVFATVFENFSV